MEFMTPTDVALYLKISVRTVYENQKRLGGIYPAGIKVLRFRKEFIHELVERQKAPGLEIQLPVSGKGLRRGRLSNQSRSQKSKRGPTGRGQEKSIKTNPDRHGL